MLTALLRAGPDLDDPDDGRRRGSVTPLVIGMLVCLLVLTAGVTAAGSAFLAGQRLQRLCDGAVAAAVGAVDPRRESAAGVSAANPVAAANEYLRVRGPDVGAVVTLGAQTVSARCSNAGADHLRRRLRRAHRRAHRDVRQPADPALRLTRRSLGGLQRSARA